MTRRRASKAYFLAAHVLALATVAVWLAAPLPSMADDAACLECHTDTEQDLPVGYRVNTKAWEASVHASMGLGCTDCHEGKEEFPHDTDKPPTACAECHEDTAALVARSLHNKVPNGVANGSVKPHSPCAGCHGVHDVLSSDDPASKTFFRNIPQTCGACHGNIDIAQANALSTAPFENFRKSVHGLHLKDENSRPAVCTSCHGSHLVLRASDPESSINPFRIPDTCGQCHTKEAKDYKGSVHGVAFRRGVTTAPNCTVCHGIHTIKMMPKETATPAEARLVRSTCVTCHSSTALMSEYGVLATRVRTYEASYHGLAHKRGTAAVADCASCHGIHAIYPSSDPRSSVAPQNLSATCGNCHPGAGREFSKNPVHFAAAGETTIDVVIIEWVKAVYWSLILAVLGAMLLHNAIILRYYLRRKVRYERSVPVLQRFTVSQIAQHTILFVTFFLLALTGFALAYPDIWWSETLAWLGLTEPLRRWIHRGAAVALIATGIYHIGWLLLTSYGRTELRRIMPAMRDFRELVQNMRFHLGKTDTPPPAGKYDYPAKMEYWALVWGTIIMAITGLALWFPVVVNEFLPFWVVKVSEVIHLFEAWLATMAVLIFHFFFVIGHPEVYPMSLSMFTGDMPEEDARHHHPEWAESEGDKKRSPIG